MKNKMNIRENIYNIALATSSLAVTLFFAIGGILYALV